MYPPTRKDNAFNRRQIWRVRKRTKKLGVYRESKRVSTIPELLRLCGTPTPLVRLRKAASSVPVFVLTTPVDQYASSQKPSQSGVGKGFILSFWSGIANAVRWAQRCRQPPTATIRFHVQGPVRRLSGFQLIRFHVRGPVRRLSGFQLVMHSKGKYEAAITRDASQNLSKRGQRVEAMLHI